MALTPLRLPGGDGGGGRGRGGRVDAGRGVDERPVRDLKLSVDGQRHGRLGEARGGRRGRPGRRAVVDGRGGRPLAGAQRRLARAVQGGGYAAGRQGRRRRVALPSVPVLPSRPGRQRRRWAATWTCGPHS